MEPVDDSIRLLVINYEISNPLALSWISHAILFYFAWRFYLSSRKRITSAFRKSVRISDFQNKKSRMVRALKGEAEKHYVENAKEDFEKRRAETAKEKSAENFNNIDYVVRPNQFSYESNNLTLKYQVQYEGDRLKGNDFVNCTITYYWKDWILFKVIEFFKFMFSKEEAPDYLLPWILFVLAVTSSILLKLGVTVSDFG